MRFAKKDRKQPKMRFSGRMLSRLEMALLIALLVALCSCHSSESPSDRFQAGQVWRYKTRVGEEQSRLIVQHVLRHSNGDEVVIVAVEHLHINADPYSPPWTSISSFEFSRQALDASVVELEGTQNAPGTINGDVRGPSPEEWQKDNGEPIRVSVAEFVNILSAKKESHQYDAPLNPPLQR